MTRFLVLTIILSLSACTDGADPGCGPAPLAPGVVATFDTVNGYKLATMSVDTYNAIIAYQRASSDWATCMENR